MTWIFIAQYHSFSDKCSLFRLFLAAILGGIIGSKFNRKFDDKVIRKVFVAVMILLILINFVGKDNNSNSKQKNKGIKRNTNMEDIWALTDTNAFVVAMTEYLDNKTKYGEDMSVLSKEERIFYITQTLEMEVNNGGFSQFFYNSSGDFSNELVGAFTAIGANATAAICQKAISAFGRDIPVPLPPQ